MQHYKLFLGWDNLLTERQVKISNMNFNESRKSDFVMDIKGE